jgi:TolB-like protein
MIKRKKYLLIISILFIAIFNLDNTKYSYAVSSNKYHASANDINAIASAAADMLENNLLYKLNRTLPILSTSFVNLDNLKTSSSFGRLLGDRMASRFSQHGYKVIELKLRKDCVIIQEGKGELALSRDIKQLNNSHNVQAVIVGTYSFLENLVFVSTKIVSGLDHSILSSYDFTIETDGWLKGLHEKEFTSELTLLQPSNSSDAKLIQARLFQLGYYTSKIDGKWKKYSIAALKKFKKQNHLPNVDKWDIETQKALFQDIVQ